MIAPQPFRYSDRQPQAPSRRFLRLVRLRSNTATMVLGVPSTCDGKPLTAYAKKCPQLKVSKADSSRTIIVATLRREHMRLIVDQAQKHPIHIQNLYIVFFSGDFATASEGNEYTEPTWGGPYTFVGKISKSWMACWFLQRYGKDGLKASTLGAMDTIDDEQVKCLFCYDLQLQPTTSFPTSLTTAGLAKDTFDRLSDVAGSRLRALMKKVDLSKGKVDYLSAGCYKLEWADEKATAVTHIQSGEKCVIPLHITITRDYLVIKNWPDIEARVEYPPVKLYLHELFADTPWFAMYKKDRKGSKLLADTAKGIADRFEERVRQQVEATGMQ